MLSNINEYKQNPKFYDILKSIFEINMNIFLRVLGKNSCKDIFGNIQNLYEKDNKEFLLWLIAKISNEWFWPAWSNFRWKKS